MMFGKRERFAHEDTIVSWVVLKNFLISAFHFASALKSLLIYGRVP